MKKITLNIKINVPNDFECGDCKRCPLVSKSSIDYPGCVYEKYNCKIGFNKITCPLEKETEQ